MYGAQKAIAADAKAAAEKVRDEILRRLSKKATLDNPVVREGHLFRLTLSYSEGERLNVDGIWEDFTRKQLKKYIVPTSQYTVRATSKTGKKDT